MAQNIFEELKAKKDKLKVLTDKAKTFNWISADEHKEIIEKIDNDTLCIGVIGQMKCGKSTFLNSFVFEDDVLPSATTPMTAALSVITYGEEKKVVAEFYTADEWAEQKLMASRNIDDVSESDRSKIQAAQELVAKSNKLDSFDQYLSKTKEGKTQEDRLENLIEYVGADGKYVSITKSVKIFYPKEYLKGVEIVDTPGFNDPIVSREERTKEFLKKADVVLLMLYAGRPFDSTDRDILFKNVRECGIGKVLIGVNKYDIPYANGETEDVIVQYVKEEIEKSRKQLGDDSLKYILEATTPIPLSANMALLSELPMQKITNSDAYNHAWNQACDIFEISSQPQMREKSHIDNLINAIKTMIETNKNEILIAKPLNRIVAAGNKILGELRNEKAISESLLNNLQIPDDELEEKQKLVSRGVRRMETKIEALGDDIEDVFNSICRKGRYQLEDIIDDACNKMDSAIDNWSTFAKAKEVTSKLDNLQKYLLQRDIPRAVETLSGNSKRELLKSVNEFLDDASEIFEDYIEDFDSKSLMKSVRKEIVMEIEKKDILTGDKYTEKEGNGVGKGVAHVAVGILFGGIGLGILGAGFAIFRGINHSSVATELKSKVNDLRCNFDATKLTDNIKANKDEIIKTISHKIVAQTLNPIQNQLDECLKSISNKEAKIKETEDKVASLKTQIADVEKQVSEVESFKI